MLQPIQSVEETATPYPTVADFLRAFNEEMHSLYLLSFLLTADHDKAEQCLVSAMGECMEGIGVFMDWARSWTRGAVLKHAIQMIKPAPEHVGRVAFLTLRRSATPPGNNPFAAIQRIARPGASLVFGEQKRIGAEVSRAEFLYTLCRAAAAAALFQMSFRSEITTSLTPRAIEPPNAVHKARRCAITGPGVLASESRKTMYPVMKLEYSA